MTQFAFNPLLALATIQTLQGLLVAAEAEAAGLRDENAALRQQLAVEREDVSE